MHHILKRQHFRDVVLVSLARWHVAEFSAVPAVSTRARARSHRSRENLSLSPKPAGPQEPWTVSDLSCLSPEAEKANEMYYADESFSGADSF